MARAGDTVRRTKAGSALPCKTTLRIMKHDDKLASLVENAIDFLDRALRDLDSAPKYSVIHFYAAVELFLKARLLAEHWSLVIAKRQDADLKSFKRLPVSVIGRSCRSTGEGFAEPSEQRRASGVPRSCEAPKPNGSLLP